MGLSISYYFDSDKNLEDLVKDFNKHLGCSLEYKAVPLEEQETEEGLLSEFAQCTFFGMTLDLSPTPDYIDEGEIAFSKYKYEFDLTTFWGNADARQIKLAIMLSAIYLLHQRLGVTGMLIFNLGVLLAHYEERHTETKAGLLYDTVSGTFFDTIPSHLNVIRAKLPDDWQQAYRG